ncbi:hypothetical protein CesoFtcFv8_001607 [Champsocephalus esox]|uniref:Uncharacterized protein n=1 Tax=Champsocephalus esox TaxID=159716 RepID=A0AAN8HI11_9TELE|nr:hypothetical protein CesoFtcFv8_001607 [Champsocephalus esox]
MLSFSAFCMCYPESEETWLSWTSRHLKHASPLKEEPVCFRGQPCEERSISWHYQQVLQRTEADVERF